MVLPSAIHGYGVFATKDIPSKTRLGMYQGKRLSAEECTATYPDATARPNCLFMLRGGVVIDPTVGGNWTRWVNSSKGTSKPNNCRITNVGNIVSKRFIAKGDELFMGYGAGFWAGQRQGESV